MAQDPDKFDPRIAEGLANFMKPEDVQGIVNRVNQQASPQESATPGCPLEVMSLKFYHSYIDVPYRMEDREYNTRFPQTSTGYIMYELNLRNHKHDKDEYHTIVAVYHKPNGEVLSSKPSFATIGVNENLWSFSDGYGAPFLKWETGIYRVIILIARYKLVAEGIFTIE